MQKFVCAIGVLTLVLIVLELLVCVEGSRVRVVKVKKTRHDKRQAQITGYDSSQEDGYDNFNRNEDISYINGNRRSDRSRQPKKFETFEDLTRESTDLSRNVKRQSDHDGAGKDKESGGCLGCGNGIPGEAGKDYPTFSSPPQTKFDCKAQKFPGYYADPETQCQVFWICQSKRADAFLCPNGTIFNQQVLVCDWWFNVDCNMAQDFYTRNQFIYAGPGIDIRGEKIPVYNQPAATNRNPDSGNTAASRRNVRNENYEAVDDVESVNYPVATKEKPRSQQQFQEPARNYNKREQIEEPRYSEPRYIEKEEPREREPRFSKQVQEPRYSQPITIEISRKTTRPSSGNDERLGYTTQPSTGGYSTRANSGSTGPYQSESENYRTSVTSPSSPYSNPKQSKNPHPFLSQGTYPSQTSRQTTPITVNTRRNEREREYISGQRSSAPIQNPNSIQYQKDYKQTPETYSGNKKNSYSGSKQQEYYPSGLQRQASQRYNYDTSPQRLQTTTKRNAIDEYFDKEYLDSEDGFNFHFAKIPSQKPTVSPIANSKQYADVSVTTYRPSTATNPSKIFTSPEAIVSPSVRPIAQHPKYEDDDTTYTTPAPTFGKKIKSGKKRNTADWTSYFRPKN